MGAVGISGIHRQQANPAPQQSLWEGFVEIRKHVPQQLGQGYTQRLKWHDIDLYLFNYRLNEDVYVTGKRQTSIIAAYPQVLVLSSHLTRTSIWRTTARSLT